jgi:hypothetical protein
MAVSESLELISTNSCGLQRGNRGSCNQQQWNPIWIALFATTRVLTVGAQVRCGRGLGHPRLQRWQRPQEPCDRVCMRDQCNAGRCQVGMILMCEDDSRGDPEVAASSKRLQLLLHWDDSLGCRGRTSGRHIMSVAGGRGQGGGGRGGGSCMCNTAHLMFRVWRVQGVRIVAAVHKLLTANLWSTRPATAPASTGARDASSIDHSML